MVVQKSTKDTATYGNKSKEETILITNYFNLLSFTIVFF